jgi:hypothetical protein
MYVVYCNSTVCNGSEVEPISLRMRCHCRKLAYFMLLIDPIYYRMDMQFGSFTTPVKCDALGSNTEHKVRYRIEANSSNVLAQDLKLSRACYKLLSN